MLACLIASVIALGVFGPLSSRAQVFSFCTLYQQDEVTEDVRSILEEEWNEEESSWDLAERTVVSYDGNNPTELKVEKHDDSGSWSATERAQGTYYDTGRIKRCTLQRKQTGTFVNTRRTEFSYADGRLDVKVTQSWNADEGSSGAWLDESRTTYSYEENQKQWVRELWDPENEKWTNLTRVQKTYDQNGRVIKRITEVPDESGDWRNNQRVRRDYSDQGIVEILSEHWDETASAWQNNRRTQFSYPSSDMMEKVVQTWVQETGTWINKRRVTTKQKDGDSPKTESLIETWDEDRGQWLYSDRSETDFTIYDGVQKIKRTHSQTWTSGTSEWVNTTRSSYSYTDVIPVELASFQAFRSGESVLIRWQTASETGNAGFEVRRKAKQSGWKQVGYVESKAEGGTTTEAKSYQYTVEDLPVGIHQFRLKQVDVDGSSRVHGPVSVDVQMQEALKLTTPAPNPVSSTASLSFAVKKQARATVAVYDLLGRKTRALFDGSPTAGESTRLQFDASGLPSGSYIIRLRAGRQTRSQHVTVVQ